MGTQILLIDNYDSFVYNLAQYLGKLGADLEIIRNDKTDIDTIRQNRYSGIVISPGPGTPDDAGISSEIIRELHTEVPILGVCLGHQCIGAVFGASIISADEIRHGKTSEISHDGSGVFKGLASPMLATRYHSLCVKRDELPDELIVNATSEDGTIMGMRHNEYPLHGVQFHPESILTSDGYDLLENFLALTR